MCLKLLFQDLLVLFVDIADNFSFIFIFLWSWHFSSPNLICIHKPDCAVVILCEFTPHFKDFYIMHLLDEIAHLEALLQTVALIITLFQHCDFIATSTVVVLDCRILIILLILRSWRIKMNHYRLTNTSSTPDSGLNVPQPVYFLRVSQILL